MRNRRNDSVVLRAIDRAWLSGNHGTAAAVDGRLGYKGVTLHRPRPAVAGYMLDAARQVAPAARPRRADGILLIITVRGSMLSSTIWRRARSIEPKKSRPARRPAGLRAGKPAYNRVQRRVFAIRIRGSPYRKRGLRCATAGIKRDCMVLGQF